MNERIEKLAEQAGYRPLQGFDFANSLEESYMKRFAELLLRQVIASILITDVVMEAKGQVPTSEDYIQAINKDFGVEEK
jgi:hypothetical protein